MRPSFARVAWAVLLLSPTLRADALDELLGSRCALDPRLRRVASEVLLARDPGITLDATRLRSLAESSGLPGPAVLVALLRGDSPAERAEALRAWLDSHPAPHRSARCALATYGNYSGFVMVPRLVEVRPLTLRVALGARLHPTVSLSPELRRAAIVRTDPEGRVTRIALGTTGFTLGFESPGNHTLQVIAEDDEGPRAWATWHVSVGTEHLALPETHEGVQSTAGLLAAINALRRESGAPALRMDPMLTRLAQRFARTLGARALVAHALGSGDTPVTRLRAARIHAARVAENVARAPSLGEGHMSLLASPSHRANLLDPELDAVGVGVFETPEGVYLVELFAAQPAMD